MNTKRLLWMGLTLVMLFSFTGVAFAAAGNRPAAKTPAGSLINTVRQATERFQDVGAAEEAGYGLLHGCVSGPQEGAMGVHMVNGDLVGDGMLDATQPEALLYETRRGKQSLVGVEYVVFAEAWDASHDGPPVLDGQLFNLVGAPNRYGIPAFYELHVWAWKTNPNGTFADWNPKVTCDEYSGETGGMSH